MIEHLDRREAGGFLAEVRRVLRPGGVVRIAAPDIARLVQDYLATEDADGFVTASHMGLARPAGCGRMGEMDPGRPAAPPVDVRRHLAGPAADRGRVRRCRRHAPGKTRIEDPGELDLEERVAESVYVEAVQPAS